MNSFLNFFLIAATFTFCVLADTATAQVTVTRSGSILQITGSTSADSILVRPVISNSNNGYKVEGIDGTTINGVGSRTFASGIEGMVVDLDKGDDRFFLTNRGDGFTSGILRFEEDLTIAGGPGHDVIILGLIECDQTIDVRGGKGQDFISLGGFFTHPAPFRFQADSVVLRGGPGPDVIRYTDAWTSSISVSGGLGPDVIDLLRHRNTDLIDISAGDGRDLVSLARIQDDDLIVNIDGRNGMDRVSFFNVGVFVVFQFSIEDDGANPSDVELATMIHSQFGAYLELLDSD